MHATEKSPVLVICSIELISEECKSVRVGGSVGQRVYSSAPHGHGTLGHCSCPPTESGSAALTPDLRTAANENEGGPVKQVWEDLYVAKDSKSFIN